jgi:hypothetical protein
MVDHPNLVSIETRARSTASVHHHELCGRGDAQAAPRGSRLAQADALKFSSRRRAACRRCTRRSLVHFDIKPANIFLKGDIARLGDYACPARDESRNSRSFGRGRPNTWRRDAPAPRRLQERHYSLGILLYECLAGDVPFKGDSEWEVLKKHETSPWRSRRGPCARARRDRAGAREASRRPYESVEQMLHALGCSLGPRREHHVRVARRPLTGSRRWDAAKAPAERRRRTAPGPVPAAARSAGSAPRVPLVELAVFLILVPIRACAVVLGRVMVFLLRLPFQILGVGMRIAGLLGRRPVDDVGSSTRSSAVSAPSWSGSSRATCG